MPVHHTQATNSDDGKITEVIMMAQDDGFLPAPSITNLKAIGCILALMGTDKHKQLTDFILRQGYIDKLVSIFNICEDLNLIQNLRHLRAILAKLIEFGSFKIMEEFVKDETVFVGCIKILECEPDLLDKKSHYRAVYAHWANFKQFIPFNNPQVKPLIHRVYWLEFL
ncbi:MAG: component of IIS longevity pathway SMK-1-domain-containing protein [Linnemannia gamsii]|nr:MAG: component of IIS longevity pathway SMK-1-domain-containing protein [Linnemannia gamsii]